MREIFKFIFDGLTEQLGLPISPEKEYILLAIIGIIAFAVAYWIVGELFKDGTISSSSMSSIIHWAIRLFVFVLIWAVLYFAIIAVRFVKAHLLLSIGIVIGIVMLTISVSLIIKKIATEKGD